MSIFEVHYWPTIGRVMTVHIPAGTSIGPLVMDLRIQHSRTDIGSPWLADNTMVTAIALARAGDPSGTVYIHGENGSTMSLDTDSMSAADVYPPINPVRVFTRSPVVAS